MGAVRVPARRRRDFDSVEIRTTWMQHIVGMLLLQRTELGAPISLLSPWLDMLVRSDDEVFGLLEAQTHRRFIKTHTPLDGVPRLDSATYITVVRHPLDVALSNADHFENERGDRAVELRIAAVGPVDPALPDPEPPPVVSFPLRRVPRVGTIWSAQQSHRDGFDPGARTVVREGAEGLHRLRVPRDRGEVNDGS